MKKLPSLDELKSRLKIDESYILSFKRPARRHNCCFLITGSKWSPETTTKYHRLNDRHLSPPLYIAIDFTHNLYSNERSDLIDGTIFLTQRPTATTAKEYLEQSHQVLFDLSTAEYPLLNPSNLIVNNKIFDCFFTNKFEIPDNYILFNNLSSLNFIFAELEQWQKKYKSTASPLAAKYKIKIEGINLLLLKFADWFIDNGWDVPSSLESTLERLSLQNFDELRNDQSTSEAKSNRAKQRSIDLYPQFEQHKKDVFPSLRKELYEEDRLLTDRLFPVGDETDG